MSARHRRVLLAMPCEKAIPFPVYQAVLHAVHQAQGWLIPYPIQSMPVHLARHEAIAVARKTFAKAVDFLCFVDSDQLFTLQTIERLLSWERPVVAPVIVTRVGRPLPVAYEWTGERYEPLTAAIRQYLHSIPKGQLAAQPVQEWPKTIHALLECDAVGTGMVLLSRAALLAIEPDAEGLFCSFAKNQGEDFSLMDKLRAAKVPIAVDRGCIVGHLTWYVRSAYDLIAQEQERACPL